MSGSITYPDGRVFNYCYLLVDLPGEFEPRLKQNKPAWSTW